jgi:hypothetical protein
MYNQKKDKLDGEIHNGSISHAFTNFKILTDRLSDPEPTSRSFDLCRAGLEFGLPSHLCSEKIIDQLLLNAGFRFYL